MLNRTLETEDRMQLVNLKCPNCGGDIEKDGDSLYCKACGAAFAVNYDEADARA